MLNPNQGPEKHRGVPGAGEVVGLQSNALTMLCGGSSALCAAGTGRNTGWHWGVAELEVDERLYPLPQYFLSGLSKQCTLALKFLIRADILGHTELTCNF